MRGQKPKTTVNYTPTKKHRKNKKKGCDFFEIKDHEKLLFFILRIIGRVRIRGQKPKTTLNYTSTKKHRKK